MKAAEIITVVLASLGLIFMLISLTGIIRFPDFFTRLHAQGIGDTLGALLIIAAMMAATGAHLMTLKLFLVFAAILATNPMGTNLMMIAAIYRKDYHGYASMDHPEESGDPDNHPDMSGEDR